MAVYTWVFWWLQGSNGMSLCTIELFSRRLTVKQSFPLSFTFFSCLILNSFVWFCLALVMAGLFSPVFLFPLKQVYKFNLCFRVRGNLHTWFTRGLQKETKKSSGLKSGLQVFVHPLETFHNQYTEKISNQCSVHYSSSIYTLWHR